MLDPETIRLLAEADMALRQVRSHEAGSIVLIIALSVLALMLLRLGMKPAKKKERVFRELF